VPKKLVLAFALVAVALPAEAYLPLRDDEYCRPAVEDELRAAGIAWDSLREPDWVVETEAASPGYERVSGYRFYARPVSCAKGGIVVQMDADCRIIQTYTRRGCKLDLGRGR
jgi:hypothetical protein